MRIIYKEREILLDPSSLTIFNLYTWRLTGKYLSTNIAGRTVYLHRLIMNCPENLEVDHIDRNPNNNCLDNLRLCDRSLNNANWGKRQNTSSKYKGVCWRKDTKKWKVEVQYKGKGYNLGCFDDEVEAAKTYDIKAKELFGSFAKLNFKGE